MYSSQTRLIILRERSKGESEEDQMNVYPLRRRRWIMSTWCCQTPDLPETRDYEQKHGHTQANVHHDDQFAFFSFTRKDNCEGTDRFPRQSANVQTYSLTQKSIKSWLSIIEQIGRLKAPEDPGIRLIRCLIIVTYLPIVQIKK